MKSLVLSLIPLLFLAGCSAPGTQERRGTELGAVAGAIIGGIIGHQSGEVAAGAAIGAVVGGTAGAATGAAKDRGGDRRYERGAVSAQPRVDQFGYTMDDYIALMSADEMEILQTRAQARPEVQMGVLLTDQEKTNLRRRSVGNREIGG